MQSVRPGEGRKASQLQRFISAVSARSVISVDTFYLFSKLITGVLHARKQGKDSFQEEIRRYTKCDEATERFGIVVSALNMSFNATEGRPRQ